MCLLEIFGIKKAILDKKNKHMWRRWGKPPNFFLFDIYWLFNLENNYLFKNLFEWANKKQNDFIIYNVAFFKKIKNTRRYHYFTSTHQKSRWYNLQFLKYRVWQTEIGNFRSFFALLLPLKPKKWKLWKNEK